MEGAIARGAKVVSTEMARAAIAVTPDGSQQRSGGAEKTQGPPQADRLEYYCFPRIYFW